MVSEEGKEGKLDIVEWMIKQASKVNLNLAQYTWRPSGAAIQVRVYAEDPTKGFIPSPGLIEEFKLPYGAQGSRFETWVFRGCEITPNYDPMIVKVLQWGPTRAECIHRLQQTLAQCVIQGPPNNLPFLQQYLRTTEFISGATYTTSLNHFTFQGQYVEVIDPGMAVTIQDFPGRTKRGLWRIGVPPSGPMDHLDLRLANMLVGNAEGAAALEVTVRGPSIKFHSATTVAVAGAPYEVRLNDTAVPMFQALSVRSGDVLSVLGLTSASGVRCYIAVGGSFNVPSYLGSKSTFLKPNFGGYQGRALRAGDVISLGDCTEFVERKVPVELQPQFTNAWSIAVLPGPMANPDYLQDEAIDMLMSTEWKVHHNSNRLGVRLIGPKPQWARPDGGEGGSHPSNIHDCEYAIGTINFTGDMPIIIAHDGPSLGGFVCPITCVLAEFWKVGQVKSGDTIRFRQVTVTEAIQARLQQNHDIKALYHSTTRIPLSHPFVFPLASLQTQAVLAKTPASNTHPGMEIRLAGDSYVLVEYGEMTLDIRLRVRIHLLEQELLKQNPIGLEETAPGVRSLQIRYDPTQLALVHLLELVQWADEQLGNVETSRLPTRVFHLPLAWDHSGVQGALAQYMRSVRSEAPYLPRNIDFVAANNGVEVDDVSTKVFRASYMVLGLGDVYLGACCAVPTDPRDRLVVPKFNPARTYTQEGTVGLGGSYMCIYPMDSPGGYQLVGRTLPIWNTFGRNSPSKLFTPEKPWLLEMFDQIRFYPVPESELETLREQFRAGTFEPRVTDEVFDMGEYSQMLETIATEVKSYNAQQRTASAIQNRLEQESLERLSDELNEKESEKQDDTVVVLKDGEEFVTAPIGAKVWELKVAVGDSVQKGQVIMVLEAMKMEINVEAPRAGVVLRLLVDIGTMVHMGLNVAVLQTNLG
jgi:urea carboxylase